MFFHIFLMSLACGCLSFFCIAAAADEGSEDGKKAKRNEQQTTKVLQTYDPGLSFKAHVRRDKAVEHVAKPGWNDRHKLPVQSPRQLAHPPARVEDEKEDDNEEWLLHITDRIR